MMKNYYQVLGLSPNSSKEEIKKAYRTYALKFHPDIQKGDKFFEERFKEIQEAYDVLMDDMKKAKLDSTLNYNSFNYSDSPYFKNYTNFESNPTGITEKEKKAKRSKVYYTSKYLTINGLYIDCINKRYQLADYESAIIRKDDSTRNITSSILLIVLGIITIVFFIGIFILIYGIYNIINKEYFLFLVGKKEDIRLLNGRKSRMIKLSQLINQAINEK